jgi:hypothetical protein
MANRFGRLSATVLLGLCGLGAIWLGGLTYVVFRSTSLLMFSWFDQLGLADTVTSMRATWGGMETQIPAFLIMSAPFALWVLSYMLLIEAVWGPAKPRAKFLWKWSLPSTAIASEILQACGMLRGTFDANDLAALIIAASVGTLFPRMLYSRKSTAGAAAKYTKNFLSGSIALVVGLLVAGSEQRSNRSEQGAPKSSGDAAQKQGSDSSQGQGQSGSGQQQGGQSSGAGQQQQQSAQDGEGDTHQGQSATDPRGQSSQDESGSGSSSGSRQQGTQNSSQGQDAGNLDQSGGGPATGGQQAQTQGATGSGQQQNQSSPSAQNAAGQSDAQPQAGTGPSTITPGVLPSTQSAGSGATSGGMAPQSGGSSPFATNGSKGVPRADPITGGFVITPNTEATTASGDVQQVPQRKPEEFPEFR